MANRRTIHYDMTDDERREYNRLKHREYRERLAVLRGRPIRPYNKNANLSQMTYEERLAYNREVLRRYKERQRRKIYD